MAGSPLFPRELKRPLIPASEKDRRIRIGNIDSRTFPGLEQEYGVRTK